MLAKYRDEAQKFYYGMLPSMEGAPPAETSSILTDPVFTQIPVIFCSQSLLKISGT